MAQSAKELVEKCDNGLNPADATQDQLKALALTNRYNAHSTWLDLVHKKLAETLHSRLFVLNLERPPNKAKYSRH